jgi:tripartite-type tricarboxylate transporter receptor subunit TctC
MKKLLASALLVASAMLAGAGAAMAQAAYPSKPVTIIVAYPPGGPVDAAARLLADSLQKQFGQPFVVENRAGAAGVVGHTRNANAAPDGYTLLFAASPVQTITPHMATEPMTFDPIHGFTPIGILSESVLGIFANKNYKPNTLPELIADAKARPGKVKYGSAGIGSGNHLAGALLEQLAGISMLHVPYNGGAPAITDLINGTIDIMVISVSSVFGQVQAGQLKAIAVGSEKRHPLIPNTPTAEEAGLKGFKSSVWYALEGPPGLPRPIVDTLNAAMKKSAAEPGLIAAMDKLGYTMEVSTPEALQKTVEDESAQWAKVVKGIQK